MFTGIIQDIGTIAALERKGDLTFTVETRLPTDDVRLGASIACNGICLTVIDSGPGFFKVQLSAETLDKTTAGAWDKGTRINLERALRLGDELGGHIVSGHVDGVAVVTGRRTENESVRYVFRVPAAFAKYFAPKGSVALDGVSLTVNEVEGDEFGVNIIPHTQKMTTLGDCHPGDKVNLEVDTMARYVARMMQV